VIENNTFASGEYSIVNLAGWTPGWVQHNIFWAPTWGILNFHGMVICNCYADSTEVPVYNFYADPEFCGTIESQNLFLQSDSPCAPGNAPLPSYACDTLKAVGALPVGCGTAPTKRRSWGEIKRIYR
jgi:hypothetical protein